MLKVYLKMRPIPKKLRERLSRDPFMKVCIYNNADCSGRIEWEHAFIYSGRQINEWWAILPCCYAHHRGGFMDKDYNRYKGLSRASDEDLSKYPKADFKQMKNYLTKKYEEETT